MRVKGFYTMPTNQLGKRNLTDEQKSYLRGKRYQADKKDHGGDRKSSGQNVHLKTAERIADELGVDEKTIRRDDKFAKAVDAIAANVGKGAKAEILAAEIKIRAGRRAGEILKTVDRARTGHPKKNSSHAGTIAPTLAALGFDRKQSHRFQRLAAVPDK